MLKKWEDLPEEVKNEKTREYYEVLRGKLLALYIKRALDFLMSFILIIVLLPVMIIIAIMIKLDSRGPIIFKQARITKYGREFKIYKYRTMTINDSTSDSQITLLNDSRITKLGEKLRKYRLDELPQLLNILVGDMSFVGTRPEVPKYTAEYTPEMKATLLMSAGVTSTASILFKDEDKIIDAGIKDGKSVDEIYIKEILPKKMNINLNSIKHFSIMEDIKILFNTVLAVIK